MKSFAALSVVALAISASASQFSIRLTKLQRTGAYLEGFAEADRARAQSLKRRTTASGPTTVSATNVNYSVWTTSVGIGDPPTNYNLIVDTGSSNTLCGTGTPYVRTSTSIPTGESVAVSYGSGNFSGLEYLDQVTLAPNLVIANQSISDALVSAGFQGLGGIIGLGPVDLTRGTLSPDTNATIPTVMNNLMSQGLIEDQVLGVYFAPATNTSDTNGVLTYGGIDSSLYAGELTYAPVTETYPAAGFWGINITASTYGNHTVIPTSTAGIVDTGATLVMLADDFFSAYMDAIPGATFDEKTGLIEIPNNSTSSMQPLNFFIADRIFTMDRAAQLFPIDENTVIGGVAGNQYGVVTKLGNNSGEGWDFILGMKFLERYYAVFDTDYNRVGFAQTNNTFTNYQG